MCDNSRMASFNVHISDSGKTTVNVSPSLQKRLEAYDLNPWNKPEVESFKMNSEPTVAPAEGTPVKGD